MQHSKEAIKFADKVVNEFAEHEEDINYSLDISSLPEQDLHRLAGIIMAKQSEYAYEACGPDNPAFDKYMKSELIKAMKDSESLSTLEDFAVNWVAGTYEYMKEVVEDLLFQRLREYNQHKERD